MSRLTRDGTAEPVSRDQILRRERGQGNVHFPHFICSADPEQDWQPYPIHPSILLLYACVTMLVCVCGAVIPFILDLKLVDVPPGVTQEEGHTGFLHLLLRCLP